MVKAKQLDSYAAIRARELEFDNKVTDLENLVYLNNVRISLNDVRMLIVTLQKDGFTEIGLGDLLLQIKSAQGEKNG